MGGGEGSGGAGRGKRIEQRWMVLGVRETGETVWCGVGAESAVRECSRESLQQRFLRVRGGQCEH